jgi:DNA topoisomerase-1
MKSIDWFEIDYSSNLFYWDASIKILNKGFKNYIDTNSVIKESIDLSKELENSEKVCEFFELSKSFKHMFSIGQKKIIQQNPPRPFSTSSLLQSASSNLGMSPKETMSICQQLYQDGFITYMRTDAQTYSLSFLEEAKKWILEEKKRPEYVGDLEKLTEAVGAHEAIRVTHIEGEKPDGGKAKKIYDFIWKNTVASCMSTATMEQTPVYMSCP